MLPEGNRSQSLKDEIIHHWSPQCLAGRERRSNMTGVSLKLITRHGGFFYVNTRHRLLPHHGPNTHKARPFRGTRLKSPQGVRDLLLGATSGYLIKPASWWTYVESASYVTGLRIKSRVNIQPQRLCPWNAFSPSEITTGQWDGGSRVRH